MRIYYEEGPDRVVMGAAGEFNRGEARDVPDDLARQVMGKGTIKFVAEAAKATASKSKGGTE